MNVIQFVLTLMLALDSLCLCQDSNDTEVEEEALPGEFADFSRQGRHEHTFREDVRAAIIDAKKAGEEWLRRDFELKHEFLKNGIDTVDGHITGTPSSLLSLNDFTPRHVDILDNRTTVSTVAFIYLLDRGNLTIDQYEQDSERKDIFLEEWKSVFCPTSLLVECDPDKRFREINGHCNNLEYPSWGTAFSSHVRLIKSDYGDEYGLFGPRNKGKSGNDLPSPREISLKLLQANPANSSLDDSELTVAVPAMGQFIDHDCTESPVSPGYQGAVIGCGQGIQRFQCIDIHIPDGDPVFDEPFMEFTRTAGGLRDYCVPGPRQQLNSLTSFIDASNVYGSEEERSETLWDKNTGLLLEGFPHLPPIDTEESCVLHGDNESATYCFRAGDIRCNEMTHLTIMHTLFLRLHNRIATELRVINPGWIPRQVYEETRRIVGAVFQHLTYNHWLEIIIGEDLMIEYGLTNSSDYQYNPNMNPGTLNVFISAAFRFGHTLVQATEGLVNANNHFESEELLEKIFFNPRLVFEDATQAARFVITKPMKASDRFVSDQLANHLFQRGNKALDLMSLNIQRGRDHGLPGYLAYRRLLGIDEEIIASFDDLPSHTPEVIEIMKELYEDVEDIDIFAGGLSETVLHCGQVGETFARIIAEQFRRFKYGDRFFYRNTKIGYNGTNSFSPAQIRSIESVSLARLICVDYNMPFIQPNVFKKVHPITNALQPCDDFKNQDLDLELWEDECDP